MDISNKALALVLMAAIVVSLGGTLVSLNKLDAIGVGPTGFASSATDSGTATIFINSSAQISFVVDSINWGSGFVNNTNIGTTDYCDMSTWLTDNDANFARGTMSDTDCVNFTNASIPFQIRNDGNANATLQIQSNSTAQEFITGTLPIFEWMITTNASRSGCPSDLNSSFSTGFANVSNTVAVYACGDVDSYKFDYTSGSNVVNLDLNISIPEDADYGSHVAQITATGTVQ